MATAIPMEGGGEKAMDIGCRDGQKLWNGWKDNGLTAMGDGTVVLQCTAQCVADDCHQCRSNAMGGDVRWMAAGITMDGGGVIVMNGSSSDGQRRCNEQRDGKAIAMGNGTAVLQ
jgi:hypothetical protein